VNYLPDPAGDLAFNGVAATILRSNEAYGMQADLSDHIGDAHILRAGFFAQHERFIVNNNSLVFPADDQGNQTANVPFTIVDNTAIDGTLYGVYVQDEWKPTAALTINYGVRYDKVNTVVDETQLSPRMGLVYDVTQDLRFHAGYARYFTPPPTEKIDTTSVEKFLNTTNALPSDANTAVRSERSDYYDVGLSEQLTSQLTLGVDGYYRDVRHLQDEGQFGNALIFSAFNYQYGKIYGVELSANYHGETFNGYANVARSLARGKGIESGQFNFDPDELDYTNSHFVHLDHDQTLTASAGISYKWSNMTVGADAIYGSGLRNGFANTGHLPAYTQVNIALTQKIDIGNWRGFELRVSLINLFDQVYELRDGTGIGVGAPQFGPRRGGLFTLNKSF
jgi:outer membrane receptor protein involved in Fe transport